MAFRDHFSGVADQYAASRPNYPRILVDRLAQLAPARGRVWDAGCGSGQLSVLLGDAFDEVVATDASSQQIAAAKPHPHVTYRVAPAETSGLPAASIDLCVAAQAVHWFDLDRYYDEVRRVAKPDGAIALVTYHRPRLDGEVAPPLEALMRAVGPYWPPERKPVEELYANVPFPFDEVRLPEMWIELDWPLEQLIGYVRTWSSTQGFVRAMGAERLAALEAPIREAWGDAARVRHVRWPLGVRAGRV